MTEILLQKLAKSRGASTLCRMAECNKMSPRRVANGEINGDINAARLRQGSACHAA